MDIYEHEKPLGIVAALGGQTAINLAAELERRGIKLIGTGIKAIETAENRDSFEKILRSLSIPQPGARQLHPLKKESGLHRKLVIRSLYAPDYVLGGRAMQIVNNESALRMYLKSAVEMSDDQPVLVDKYIPGYELEVDAVCDGMDVFVPGIMQHIERTGIHSGDSISVYPPLESPTGPREGFWSIPEAEHRAWHNRPF